MRRRRWHKWGQVTESYTRNGLGWTTAAYRMVEGDAEKMWGAGYLRKAFLALLLWTSSPAGLSTTLEHWHLQEFFTSPLLSVATCRGTPGLVSADFQMETSMLFVWRRRNLMGLAARGCPVVRK